MCIQNLKTLALIEAEKSVTENLLGERENWINKGNDKQQHADSFTHYNKSYPTLILNFKILGIVVPEKSLTQTSLCITLEWQMEKRKNGKRRQKLLTESCFFFPQYTWPLSRCIQNLNTLSVIGAENSVTKCFIGEKEKWTNKGNDMQLHADSLLHNTTSHT